MQTSNRDPGTGPQFFDGDEQPCTMTEWLERKRRDFALLRARVHAELDALLDQQQARMDEGVAKVFAEHMADMPTDHPPQ